MHIHRSEPRHPRRYLSSISRKIESSVCDLATSGITRCEREMLTLRARFLERFSGGKFQVRKRLDESCCSTRRQHETEILWCDRSAARRSIMDKGGLTSETHAWSTTEGQIAPSYIVQSHVFPPLRTILPRVLAVEILASMHVVDRVRNWHSCTNEYRRSSVSTAANGQRRSVLAKPTVDGYWGIQAECYNPMSRNISWIRTRLTGTWNGFAHFLSRRSVNTAYVVSEVG